MATLAQLLVTAGSKPVPEDFPVHGLLRDAYKCLRGEQVTASQHTACKSLTCTHRGFLVLLPLICKVVLMQAWWRGSFWNFDALFQPQQHPARDAHDTFFVTGGAQ